MINPGGRSTNITSSYSVFSDSNIIGIASRVSRWSCKNENILFYRPKLSLLCNQFLELWKGCEIIYNILTVTEEGF